MRYRLRHYPYSGGHIDLLDEGELGDCRARAARRIYRHRNVMEYPVAVMINGFKWEMETGADAGMIGDGEGVMCIEAIDAEDPEMEDELDLGDDDYVDHQQDDDEDEETDDE